MKYFVYLTMTALMLGVAYGLWITGKWLNYKFAYESGVERTIQEMVKPECLKENAHDPR